jgi:hypothetical protein
MAEPSHVGLRDLPQFTVQVIQGDRTELVGIFDRLQFVKPGRAWLYRARGRSFDGDLVSVNSGDRTALIEVFPGWLPPLLDRTRPRGLTIAASVLNVVT